MKNSILKTGLMMIAGAVAGISAMAQPVCNQYGYFYSDINYPGGVKQSDIYSVSLEAGNAVLSPIALDLNYGAHIAFDEASKLLYLVNDANGAIQTLDPSTGVFGAAVLPEISLSGVTTAAISEDGKLLVGSSNGSIYEVTFGGANYAVQAFDTGADISGGDITFTDNGLLLASKPNGYLYTVLPEMMNILQGSVNGQVTGIATAEDGEGILISSRFNSAFLQYEVNGGVNEIASYPAILDGEAFTLDNGDMASGCLSSSSSIDGCEDFRTYYIHDAQGGGPDILFQVDFNNVGGASLTQLTTLPGASHLGIGEDGLLYIVRHNNGQLTVWDPSTLSTVNQVQIAANGNNVNNIPAVVVGDDGLVYVGASNDKVYSVDPATGEATFIANADVNGGDLVFIDGALWLANRAQGRFYEVGGEGQFDVAATEINGVSVLPDGNLLIANGNLGSNFEVYVPGTGEATGETFFTGLTLFNGDLASRCFDQQASIEGCYAAEVLAFDQGLKTNGMPVSADRSNPEAALGQPDASNAAGGFVSLGVGGSITLGFSGAAIDGPGADIKVYETSFSGDNCGFGDDESALVELSQDGFNWVSAGTICRDGEFDIAALGLEYVTLIRITNAEETSTPDGYDVDGVEAVYGCGSIPVIETGNCNATEVVEYVQGSSSNGGSIAFNRTNAEEALGEPERTNSLVFVSLGYGGSLTLAFDGAVPNMDGDDIEIVETTYNFTTCEAYAEYADVYVSVDGVEFTYAKTICRADNFVDISDAGNFSYINFVKIVNNNELSTTPDAFDVDGVVAIHNCQSEPEIVDPNCTNDVVYVDGEPTGDIVRLTAMGSNLGCDGLFGYRWRIRNETSEPVEVFYNFAGAPALQGPFQLEAGQAVFFTSGFGAVANQGGTMRIFVDGEQVNVKAHGGTINDLSECLAGGCPDDEAPAIALAQEPVQLTSYPNPTEGVAVIEFSTPVTQNASLEVMDMSGRTVVTLFNQAANADQVYRVDFNGLSLPTGIYITKLTTETETIIEKMMIAR